MLSDRYVSYIRSHYFYHLALHLWHLPCELYEVWQVVVQIGKGNLVLCANLLPDDDLVHIVKLIPVFISVK